MKYKALCTWLGQSECGYTCPSMLIYRSSLLDDLVSVTFIPIHGLVRSRQSQIERWWSREWKQTLLHKSLFFLLCRPWGNVEELGMARNKISFAWWQIFHVGGWWVVATQVDCFSPHSNIDASIEILCLMYVLKPSQGVIVVRKPMYRRIPSHWFSPTEGVANIAVCMFSCAFGGVFYPKKIFERIYSLTKIHYKHEHFCTCVRNSDRLSQDIYTGVLLLMYPKKILQFLTNSGIIVWVEYVNHHVTADGILCVGNDSPPNCGAFYLLKIDVRLIIPNAFWARECPY